ncbi:spermidine/putrescine ABC transporter ATP-binding protein [Zavarzinia aquatilis]|uniref:Spermidine/putrescine import ATP-binding protein PotA n=1 Tax=Zavarzinia aquatilis TaxID=2211142 RepID=A0A317DV60_9PROT|nr:spermidine/putrescine ABC transporter ATP-binding protein [Zavarzinia aquatilis]
MLGEGVGSCIPAIEARSVVKSFPGGAVALDHVSIDIRPNEFFTLLGPSGCGKTTLLRLIAGFEQPTAGEIYLDGERIEHLPPFRRPINTVFQSYALFPHMTVGQNIAFGLEMQGIAKAEIARRVAEMLALVKLEGFEGRKADQMSGGQQQRVALARALANKPKVLLLDEPLSALDLKLRKEMQFELKRLQTETGITFVFVTHDQEEALTMSDRIAVMSAGRVLQVGAPRDIYENPEHRFVADFIGETDFLDAMVEASDDAGVRYRLSSGAFIDGPPQDFNAGASVALSTRPERLHLGDAAGDGLAGTIDAVVYFGTDTTFHVALDGGAGSIRVREQNIAGKPFPFDRGDRVTIQMPRAAVRAFRDFKG